MCSTVCSRRAWRSSVPSDAEFVADRFLLVWRQRSGRRVAGGARGGLRVGGRVAVRPLVGRVRRGCVPRAGRVGGEAAELVEDVAHGVGLRGRPVGERLLGGDELGDLFEFDEVWPVGDDPVAALVLGGHRGGEVLVHLGGVEVGVHDAVDELALIGGRGRQELLQFLLAVDEFGGRAGRQAARRRGWGGRRARGGLRGGGSSDRCQRSACRRVSRAWSDAGFGVGDVVEEAVVGDAGGGVVPH